MNFRDFKQLKVWQKSVQLSILVYKLTGKFPSEEKFGLVSQMRRCAVSIPSNIAEGKKRGTKKDFKQFLRIADGSAAELETQLIISKELFKNINFSQEESLLLEVQKMLAVLLKHLSTSNSS